MYEHALAVLYSLSRSNKLRNDISWLDKHYEQIPIIDYKLSDGDKNKYLNGVIKNINEAVSMDPELKDAYYYLGIAHINKASLSEYDMGMALEAFLIAIKHGVERENAYALAVIILIDKKKYTEAERVLQLYENKYPKYVKEILDLKSTLDMFQKKFDNVIQYGQQLVQIDPASSDGYLMMANAYYAKHDAVNADIQYKTAVEKKQSLSMDIESIKEGIRKSFW